MSEPLLLIHTWIFFAAGCALSAVGLLIPPVQEVVLVDAFALFVSSLTYLSVFGIAQEYVRWTGYTFACAGFTYVSARVLKQNRQRALAAAGLMAITIFTGALIYFMETDAQKYMLFAIGSGTYIASMFFVIFPQKLVFEWSFRMFEYSKFQWIYIAFFIIAWSVYPIIYVLGPAVAGVIDGSQEEIAYFVLEFPAKYGIAALSTSYELYEWFKEYREKNITRRVEFKL